MSDETRTFYVGLVYNWESRRKVFVPWEDVGPVAQNLGPGDQLYLLDATLEPPKEDRKIQRAWCQMVRHDNPKPLKPHQTLHENILSRLDSLLSQSMPAGTFGPEIGPFHGRLVSFEKSKSVTAFTVPGHRFKLTIEEITEEDYKALPPFTVQP